MKTQDRFFRGQIAWITRRQREVGIRQTQSTAPNVCRLTGEAVRKASGQLHLQRMISGVAWVAVNRDSTELWIEYKEILRERPAVSNVASPFSRHARAAIQKVRQPAGVTVGD